LVANRLAGTQRRPNRSLQRRENSAFIAEPDLTFGGMHVDVDEGRVDADVDGRDRVPAALEAALVALFQRV
jgi:hypothetical protein